MNAVTETLTKKMAVDGSPVPNPASSSHANDAVCYCCVECTSSRKPSVSSYLHHVQTISIQARPPRSAHTLHVRSCALTTLLGESAVGKSRYTLPLPSVSPRDADTRRSSSLVLRFVKDQFDDYRESTIGGTLCQL